MFTAFIMEKNYEIAFNKNEKGIITRVFRLIRLKIGLILKFYV